MFRVGYMVILTRGDHKIWHHPFETKTNQRHLYAYGQVFQHAVPHPTTWNSFAAKQKEG